MPGSDRLGYYKILNVSHNASDDEIELAYRFLKQAYLERRGGLDIRKIQVAYKTLCQTSTRAVYDMGPMSRRTVILGGGGQTRLQATRVLLVLMVLFFAVVLFFHGPAIRARFTSFSPGTALVWRNDGSPLGTVQRFEKKHVFHNGATGSAYLIALADGAVVWYPASDLARLTAAR